jgi:hypothetical protein
LFGVNYGTDNLLPLIGGSGGGGAGWYYQGVQCGSGGRGQGLLFRKGEVVRKVPQEGLADALVEEAWRLAEEEGE